MRKYFFTGLIACVGIIWQITGYCQSGAPSLQVKAYQRIILRGAAPSVEIEVGGVEKSATILPPPTEFFIYLIASKASDIKLNQVWIKQESYEATLNRVSKKPVVLINGKHTDTLVGNIRENVWQININQKMNPSEKPKKNFAGSVLNNELVLRLSDAKGNAYIRTVKYITTLEPQAGI